MSLPVVTEEKKQNGSLKIAAAVVATVVGVVALAGHSPFDHGFEEHVPRILVSDAKIFSLAKNSRVKYSTLSGHHQRKLFTQFQEDFGKEYKGSKEEKSRLKHFKNFLEIVDERNAEEVAAGGEALHGITKFADLSQSEFEESYLGSVVMIKEKNLIDTGAKEGAVNELTKEGKESKDWTGIYTTNVNDQGACGSSWAFAAVQQIESDAVREGLLDVDNAKLSVQQAVSCNTEGGQDGCNGGYMFNTFSFTAATGGLATYENYAYVSGTTGGAESCNKQESVVSAVTVKEGLYFYNAENKMQDYVLTTGPLASSVSARRWNTYVSGTMMATACSDWDTYQAWHSVQVTGVDLGKGYWKVRNSWGSDWGEDGYIYLQTDATATTNTCGIASFSAYSDVEPAASKSQAKN